MADRAIKVIVLEGNFASLCALGFSLSLSIQLQQSCLKLSEAHWTSRSTDTGFSVSFFWPAAEKVNMDIKKRKRRKRGKARPQVVRATTPNPPKQCAPYRGIVTSASKKLSPDPQTPQRPPNEKSVPHQHDEHQSASSSPRKEDDNQWTKVTRKRRSRGLPPCWKLKVPVHLRDSLKTPSSSTSSTDSEGTDYEQSDTVEMPHSQPTPIASRTRSRMKHFRDT